MTRATGPYPFPAVPVPVRHFVALAAVVIAFMASRNSENVVDEGGLFLLLGITVTGAAWFAGTGNALAVTILGALLAGSAAPGGAPVAVHMHLALFVVEGLLLTALVAELRRSRRVAESAAAAANDARREAEAASRTKDEFLGTVSHELRTPINAVLGWLHLVRSGKLDRATEARGLESIERNIRLQAQVIADLLDVSKALTGRLDLEISPVSFKTAVKDAALQAATAASAKNITLDVQTPDAPVIVRGDANRLRHIVWHLLANAIKFTPRGGAVRLALETNGEASVTVRDSGPGIAPDFLPRVFDQFTQADSSPTRSAGGLGLGLSLVRALVERHGGEVHVSNGEEGGAVFRVSLPLRAEDQAGRGPRAWIAHWSARGRRRAGR